MTHKIARRYAKALFNLAGNPEHQEKHVHDLEKVSKWFKETPQLEQFLSAPHVSKQKKSEILQEGLKRKLDSSLLSFLLFLLEKGRLKYLPEITQEYHHLVTELLGILEVSLITAIPITAKMKEQLQEKLAKTYQKKIRIKEVVDPEIIGGAVLVIANKMLDFSIRERLAKLQEDLLAVSIS